MMSIEGRARADILNAAKKVGRVGAHIAPSLSVVDICLAVLKKMKTNDIFVLSKGHGALGYYAAMHQLGKMTDEAFASFEDNGGQYPGQPSRTEENGIQYSSGSLGMGLAYGAGVAWARRETDVYVISGDGELDEGSVWEAALFAKQNKLNNLVLIVDNNGLQSDGKCCEIMDMDLDGIFTSLGWNVLRCDGHVLSDLESCVIKRDEKKPTVIIARTIKGKGISFMENDNLWHHSELKEEQFNAALVELGEKYGLGD